MKAWASEYLSVPYLDGGRTREGADCFGLYAIILADRAGIAFPEYSESWGNGADGIMARMQAELAAGRWLKLPGATDARELDCVRMVGHAKGRDGIVRRSPVHLGCFIGNGRVIHTEDKRGPRIMHIEDGLMRHRIVGFYRPLFLGAAT